MTMKFLAAGMAAAALLLSACQPAPAAKTDEASAAVLANSQTAAATITAVTDAGYPMFAVTATVADQPLELLLNAEEADLGGVEPAALAGKAVTLGYASKEELSLIDVRADGRSLLGEAAPKADDPAWSVVTGTLSGAARPTAGDLPDVIEIADAQGAKHAFEYFITPEIAAANGKLVTGYYVASTVNRVTSVELSRR